jgi:cytochrome P450
MRAFSITTLTFDPPSRSPGPVVGAHRTGSHRRPPTGARAASMHAVRRVRHGILGAEPRTGEQPSMSDTHPAATGGAASQGAGTCPFRTAAEIDFMDPVVQEHWFDAYDVLRNEAPIYYMPQLGMHVLTRYDDIEHLLRRPLLFTAGPDVQDTEPLVKHAEARALYEQKGWARYTPLGENLPKHEHYRALVDPLLTLAAIRSREGFIRGVIDELIDAWIDAGEVDFNKGFAEPLPMIVIAELLGFPRMDLPQLKEWSYAWVLPFSRGLTLEQETWAVSKHIELQHYINDALKEKRRAPKDDILSHLAQVEYDDVELGKKRPLTDTEIIGITDHLLIGGNETTQFALANGLWLLFRFPEAYAELQADHGKIRNFVEEVLRIESPTQGLYRFVTEDTVVNGTPLKKGAMLNIRYGAGNRDPERFPNPGCPVLERRNAGRHLAFGIGEHVCPGATLSRVEQQLAWEHLLKRTRNLRPVPEKDDYTHVPGIWLRALKSIHMRFDKA